MLAHGYRTTHIMPRKFGHRRLFHLQLHALTSKTYATASMSDIGNRGYRFRLQEIRARPGQRGLGHVLCHRRFALSIDDQSISHPFSTPETPPLHISERASTLPVLQHPNFSRGCALAKLRKDIVLDSSITKKTWTCASKNLFHNVWRYEKPSRSNRNLGQFFLLAHVQVFL